MKTIFFVFKMIAFVIISHQNCLGQYNHIDIEPNTTVCRNQLSFKSDIQFDTIIYVDIENDGNNDFYFKLNYIGSGVYYHRKTFSIDVFPYSNTTIASNSSFQNYALVLDSIGYSEDTWSMSSSKLTLYIEVEDLMMDLDTIDGFWYGQNDKYIFLQSSNIRDSLDVWIKISCDSSHCLIIKDYFYVYTSKGNTLNDANLVFPNPSTGIINVSAPNNLTTNTSVYALDGTLIITGISQKTFNLRDYTNRAGLYILNISTLADSRYCKVLLE